jgi:hypothetical protein
VATLILEMAVLGIAVALTSPGSVVTVLALLSMSSGVERALAFIAGWILAIGVIAVLMAFVLQGQDFHSRSTSPSRAASAVEVLLGLLLVAVAARAYRHPRHKPKNQSEPRWLARVNRSHPILEVLVGVIMLSYALTLTAAAETAKANVDVLGVALAGFVFAARPRSSRSPRRWSSWPLHPSARRGYLRPGGTGSSHTPGPSC